jgi:FkbM family methyltransferase
MTLGQITKKTLRHLGIHAYSWNNLPWGISLERDIERLLKPRQGVPTLFDVGANIGQTALRFRKAAKHAIIHSFEPIAETYDKLMEKVRGDSRIYPHQLALGDITGKAAMEILESSEWNRVVGDGFPQDGRTQSVSMKRLDTFCQENSIPFIDLLKTDCEGFDHEVLKGAGSMLRDGDIGAVLCEVNLRRDGKHSDFFAIHEFLSSNGYYSFAFYDYSGWGTFHSQGSFQNALWLRLPAGSISTQVGTTAPAGGVRSTH